MRCTAIALLALGLAACSGGGGKSPTASLQTKPATPVDLVQLTPSQRAVVENGVRRGLKDPNSALFGEEMKAAAKGADTYVVCGWVNSKNSFGGYVGEKPFLATYLPPQNKALLIGVGGSDIDTRVVMMQCSEYGISLGPI